jgi:two-component system, NarL family, nitrate/nitrite response regulator NarL
MHRLTPREREVALQVSAGLSNKRIARQLNIHEGTVKVHLHSVFEKLALSNRTQLAVLAATAFRLPEAAIAQA